MSSWSDSRRADRVADREQTRADRMMLLEQRRTDREHDARIRAQAEQAARERRAAARAKVTGWVRTHVMDLMFIPVIIVPAMLAWTAMAVYGVKIFGPVGVLLPLFSEGAMWVFAIAVAIAARAGRSTAWLHTGTTVFALVAAVLNFVHGYQVAGLGHAIVMAVVSVGGVVVHQLVHANPMRARRTRTERAARRIERDAQRRVLRVRRAAVRQAVAELAADGTATLVHRPGLVTLGRRFGRTRLVPAVVPGLPVTADDDTATDVLADEISAYLAALPALVDGPAGNGGNGAGSAQTPVVEIPAEIADKFPGYVARVRAAIDTGRLPAQPSQADVRKFLRIRGSNAVAVWRAVTNQSGPDDDGREEVTA